LIETLANSRLSKDIPRAGNVAKMPADKDLFGYRRYIEQVEEPWRQKYMKNSAEKTDCYSGASLSILMPVYKPVLSEFKNAIYSVINQSCNSWELCICFDSNPSLKLKTFLAYLSKTEPRIKYQIIPKAGISRATNAAFSLSSGDLIGFLDQDDQLAPFAVQLVLESAIKHKDAEVFYSDEDKIDEFNRRCEPFFKPDYSPQLLLTNNYICHFLVVKRHIFESLEGMRSEFDGSQDWDFILRATEIAKKTHHIKKILYHWKKSPQSAALLTENKTWAVEAGKKAVESALIRRKESASISKGPLTGTWHIHRTVDDEPHVSLIIPFRDQPDILSSAINSFLFDPGLKNIEILFMNTQSQDPEIKLLLNDFSKKLDIKVIDYNDDFNWAKINNIAAQKSSGEYLVFLNNDLKVLSDEWLYKLISTASVKHVGAVGARLVYPDMKVQHAGVVIGLNSIADHAFINLDQGDPGYFGLAKLTREVSAVTGACMAVRKSVFDSAGGFDEAFTVAFNDIDFCLRLGEMGYYIIYQPQVELIHFESKSRGRSDDSREATRFLKKWERFLNGNDPYFNPNLSTNNAAFGF
jgi:GT2 family glycosyltransferase